MKYTIQVNQAGADAANLRGKVDIIDLAIFDAFKDFANGMKCEKKICGGRVWFWISYKLIIDEIPYCNILTNDGIYRRMKNLQAAGVIDFHPDNQKTGKTFFSWGAAYDTLISDRGTDEKPEGVRMKNRRGTDEKPEGYGLKTGGGTDEKPDNHYTIDHYTNPETKKENSAAKPLSPPFQKIGEVDLPENLSLETQKKEKTSPGAGANETPVRSTGAVRLSIVDPELPGVRIEEEIQPQTPPEKTGRSKQARHTPQIHPENESCFQYFSEPERARAAWQEWVEYKYSQHREKYKEAKTELAKLRQLFKQFTGDAAKFEEAVNYSIGNLYRGVFAPKSEKENGKFQQLDKAQQQHLNLARYVADLRSGAAFRDAGKVDYITGE